MNIKLSVCVCVCLCVEIRKKKKRREEKKSVEKRGRKGKLWRDFVQISTHLTINLESFRRLISDLNIICGKCAFILG